MSNDGAMHSIECCLVKTCFCHDSIVTYCEYGALLGALIVLTYYIIDIDCNPS